MRSLLLKLSFILPLFMVSGMALADYDYPDQPTERYGNCEKVADLVDSNVDVLVCKISRNKSCLALSNGSALECGLSSRFRYRSGGSYRCSIVANLSESGGGGGGGYPVEYGESIQECLIGSGRSGVKILVTGGDIDII